MKKDAWKEECKKYIKERGYIIRPNESVYTRYNEYKT